MKICANLAKFSAEGDIRAKLGTVEIDLAQGTRKMTTEDGRLVTMDLGPSDVHIDRAVANFATGYSDKNLIADMVSAPVLVDKLSDNYYEWDKDNVLDPVDTMVSGGLDKPAEVSPKKSNKQFNCRPYALAAVIPQELLDNADDALAINLQYAKRIVVALRKAREIRVANMLLNAASYGALYTATIAAGAKWNGGASSDPIADIHTRMENALMPTTGIVMSRRTYNAFVRNANVNKFFTAKDSAPGAIPDFTGNNASLFQLPPITVADVRYKNAAGAYPYIWGDDVLLVHSPGQPSLAGDDVATSYTFRFKGGSNLNGSAGGGVSGLQMDQGYFARSYFDQTRGPRGSQVMVVGHYDHEVLTSDVVSGLIKAAWQ
jgi:hypothetical protein